MPSSSRTQTVAGLVVGLFAVVLAFAADADAGRQATHANFDGASFIGGTGDDELNDLVAGPCAAL